MLTYDLEQGSEEWLKLRLGVPSGSNFGRIITPTGKPSGQLEDYANELVAELITGHRQNFFKSDAMLRGNELEPDAVACYEALTRQKTKVVGFVTSDDGRVGCSPDRLVGKDGLLEIKCPLQNQHLKNLLSDTMDMKYYPQVQGQMWLTERDWCDFMSYHPEIQPVRFRVERDDSFISTLEELVDNLIYDMDIKIIRLIEKNVHFKARVELRHAKIVENKKEGTNG